MFPDVESEVLFVALHELGHCIDGFTNGHYDDTWKKENVADAFAVTASSLYGVEADWGAWAEFRRREMEGSGISSHWTSATVLAAASMPKAKTLEEAWTYAQIAVAAGMPRMEREMAAFQKAPSQQQVETASSLWDDAR